MLALQLVAGSNEPELRETAEPSPGPGEVLVRVGGAGACHSDLHLLDMDTTLLPWPMPFTLGHENAGWVAALGEGVTGLDVGEPVAVYGPRGCGRCRRCIQGMENYCERQSEVGAPAPGIGSDGGMAPLMVAPNARCLVPLGDLDPVVAAPLTDAGLTPYAAIKRSLAILVPGSTAVVIGVGGLGHLAIQILRALAPTTVIAVDTNEKALRVAESVGAHHAVPAGETAVAEIRSRTGGVGADLVLDLVGLDDTMRLGAAVARTRSPHHRGDRWRHAARRVLAGPVRAVGGHDLLGFAARARRGARARAVGRRRGAYRALRARGRGRGVPGDA